MTEDVVTHQVWQPSRWLTDALLAALVPVTACSVALVGLTAWAGSGNAGSPARIAVTSGRVVLPDGESKETVAFFDVYNPGGSDDQLVEVTSAAVTGEMTLSHYRAAGGAAAHQDAVDSVTVPARGFLTMSSRGAEVVVPANAAWRAGDIVALTLHFRHSGWIKNLAVVLPLDVDAS